MIDIVIDIQKDVKEIEKIMSRNTVSLEEHIRRTNLLEQKMSNVEKHVNMVQGAGKLLLSSGILLALYEFVSKLF